MLDKRYGLRYSMPHSVVHIVDNSMYTGELPLITVDDPSIYSTIVVTGTPIGIDNEIVSISRSDVLNVAFGMGSITKSDIDKYGQTITYPSDLLNQNVPIKMLRVTPDGATYAFSCLLLQWRIVNGTLLSVRYKTTENDINGGIPAGKVLQNFKNPKRLHEAFVNNTPKTVTDIDGTVWNQRVLMTFISAGRGSGYNKFHYTINQVQQSRRPANVKYLFTTFDSTNNGIVEKFFASLFNENNELRPDATDPVNTAVSKRVAGSSVIIPTLNEDAVRELYKEYMTLLKRNIDNEVYINTKEEVEYNNNVYKRMRLNIFDPIFGRYIYDGDSDVKLPFMRVEMVSMDVPRLDPSKYIMSVVGDKTITRDSPTLPALVRDKKSYPTEIQSILMQHTVGINNPNDKYHIGNVYLSDENATSLIMTVTINQFTGGVTNIPITQIREINETTGQVTKKTFATTVKIGINENNISEAVKAAIDDKIASGGYTPTRTVVGSEIKYENDFIIFINPNVMNTRINCPTFGIAYVTYNNATSISAAPTVNSITLYRSKNDIYPILVYPSTTVTSFAYNETQSYYGAIGTTIVDGGMLDTETTPTTHFGDGAAVYVNSYYDKARVDANERDKCLPVMVQEEYPFVQTIPPSNISITNGLSNEMYDLVISLDSELGYHWRDGVKYTFTGSMSENDTTNWIAGYYKDDIVSLEGLSELKFKVTEIAYFKNAAGDKFIEYTTGQAGMGIRENKDITEKTLIKTMTIEPVDEELTVYPSNDVYRLALPEYSYRTIEFKEPAYVAGKYFEQDSTDPSVYTAYAPETEPTQAEWVSIYPTLYTYNTTTSSYVKNASVVPTFEAGKYYKKSGNEYTVQNSRPDDWDTNYFSYYIRYEFTTGMAPMIYINKAQNIYINASNEPYSITRYVISGPIGSVYNYGFTGDDIPANYYSDTYGINPTSEAGGVNLAHGSTGFFDNDTLSPIIFKWRYSELLVRAYKGLIDPRIKSPIRCPAKYLFDGGTNTIIGQKILPYMSYSASDIIQASTIFTDDEKDNVILDESIVKNIGYYDQEIGIDVKQAMYDLMEYRCYYGLPEDKRPVGPGSGLSLHLDSGNTSAAMIKLMNQSFIKRFSNPNASWDIGGYTSITDGITYTYTKHIVQNLFNHIRTYSINKPFIGTYSQIPATEYSSFYPDLDVTDWEERELYYNSGGNAWIMDANGNLQRKSQRSLYREGDTSDLIQESNMRTLSLLVYMLQNKIDSYLLEYNDDGVLKTLKEEVDNMFSNWVGNLVQGLDITFERDINPYDGGEIVVCYCNVTFRGLILRVPIIVNIQRRNDSGETT